MARITKKNKLQRELNKYKRIWERYQQTQNNSKSTKSFIDQTAQIEQYQPESNLRKQFAGILGGKISFNDRQLLQDQQHCYIVGFMVYELQHALTTKNNLVALRAIYNIPVHNPPPIPGHYLSKCKLHQHQLMEGDFVKLLKIKYQASDNHILKIEIRTNRNHRYQFGDKKMFSDLNAGENVYGFDIAINEYPVCLFGSYQYQRSHWHMQSLGVEINQLPQ